MENQENRLLKQAESKLILSVLAGILTLICINSPHIFHAFQKSFKWVIQNVTIFLKAALLGQLFIFQTVISCGHYIQPLEWFILNVQFHTERSKMVKPFFNWVYLLMKNVETHHQWDVLGPTGPKLDHIDQVQDQIPVLKKSIAADNCKIMCYLMALPSKTDNNSCSSLLREKKYLNCHIKQWKTYNESYF